jgi:hypothetical protein
VHSAILPNVVGHISRGPLQPQWRNVDQGITHPNGERLNDSVQVIPSSSHQIPAGDWHVEPDLQHKAGVRWNCCGTATFSPRVQMHKYARTLHQPNCNVSAEATLNSFVAVVRLKGGCPARERRPSRATRAAFLGPIPPCGQRVIHKLLPCLQPLHGRVATPSPHAARSPSAKGAFS